MSDEELVQIIRGFTDDDRLCIKIVGDELNQVYNMMFIDVLYTITEHTHYWRCNDQWYPTNGNGVERMMSDIQRELGLGAAQMKELDHAIADLMIAGG
jgi:hypothetical protein